MKYCRKCGAQNADEARQCALCGESLEQTPSAPIQPRYQPSGGDPSVSGPRPSNYLVWSILSTVFPLLCCCLPVGIVAIVYSAQVDSKYAAGDYAGAVDSAGKAKTWAWVSFGVGLVAALFWIAMIILGVIGAMAEQ